jgi:hypothetical protein
MNFNQVIFRELIINFFSTSLSFFDFKSNFNFLIFSNSFSIFNKTSSISSFFISFLSFQKKSSFINTPSHLIYFAIHQSGEVKSFFIS